MIRSSSRLLRWLTRGVAGAGLAALALFAACSTPGEKCVGGKIEADGSCSSLCDPSKCLPGNTCVDNQCVLVCSQEADCYGVVEDCVPAVDDVSHAAINVCRANGHAAVGGGWDKSCPIGASDCSATACPNGFECDANACGGHPDQCIADPIACAGKDTCNVGRCSADNAPCTMTLCPAAECKPFHCITEGEGDTHAYCTATDCLADSDCAAGYYCGEILVPREICGNSTVGSHPRCGVPNNPEPCVDAADLTGPSARNARGETFFEGPMCLERRSCLKSTSCAICDTHMDCSQGDFQLCAGDGTGTTQCHAICVADSNCLNAEQCLPAGFKTCNNAYTKTCTVDGDCPVAKCVPADAANPSGPKACAPGGKACSGDQDCVDTCVDRSTCIPRTGCRPDALPGGFCENCVADSDCGAPGSSVGCANVGGVLFQPEFACFDYHFANACTTDADCPTAPGGAHGRCLNESDGVTAGSSVYHKCFFPKDPAPNQGFKCWL